MAKLIATIKAVITRILFGTHGFIAIWQVARNKEDPQYWYLCVPIGLLVVEGLFTLAIKKNQEWRWFCPSVFLYLSSMVPAIWLLELDKIDRRMRFEQETGNLNLTALGADLRKLDKLLGVQIKLPDIQVDPSTWITLIEQFLMLILIVGRWMLPKGDLTRDQLSQLLLVYIGTAADIIEFFDSYKDNTIASEPLLVFLTLSIWSWSLLQFTIVLSATRSRKPRGGGSSNQEPESNECCGGCCCSIDVWGITLNIILQDAPFLAFRLLIIVHYRIVTYMNVFFTCKNTLVILLQLYRLYVVRAENKKATELKLKQAAQNSRKKRNNDMNEMNHFNDIYIISNNKCDKKRRGKRSNTVCDVSDDDQSTRNRKHKQRHQSSAKPSSGSRKDNGYSTASSSKSQDDKKHEHSSRRSAEKSAKSKTKRTKSEETSDCDRKNKRSSKKRSASESSLAAQTAPTDDSKKSKQQRQRSKDKAEMKAFTEESDTSAGDVAKFEVVNEKETKRSSKKQQQSRKSAKNVTKSSTSASSSSSSGSSSE